MRVTSSHAPAARSALSSASLALVLLASTALLPDGARAQDAQPYAPPAYETVPAQPVPAQPVPAQPVPGQPVPNAPPPSYGYGQVVPQPGAPVYAPTAPAATQARRVPVERTETIRGLWLPGLIVLPIAWVTTWTVASSAFYGDAVTFSWIPVVGPWLMLTQDLNGNEGGAIFAGVVQGAATLAILLGLTIRRTYTDYEYVIEPVPGARLRLDALTLPGGGMIGASLEM